jgi:hypothetical protein
MCVEHRDSHSEVTRDTVQPYNIGILGPMDLGSQSAHPHSRRQGYPYNTRAGRDTLGIPVEYPCPRVLQGLT